jgi:hypothetical protein
VNCHVKKSRTSHVDSPSLLFPVRFEIRGYRRQDCEWYNSPWLPLLQLGKVEEVRIPALGREVHILAIPARLIEEKACISH